MLIDLQAMAALSLAATALERTAGTMSVAGFGSKDHKYGGSAHAQVSVVARGGSYLPTPDTHKKVFAAVGKLPELQVLQIVAPAAAAAYYAAATAEPEADRAAAVAPALPGLEALRRLMAPRLTTLDIAVRVDASVPEPQEHHVLPNLPLLRMCRLRLIAAGRVATAWWRPSGSSHSSLKHLSVRSVGSVSLVEDQT